jgi:hypothetical protein
VNRMRHLCLIGCVVRQVACGYDGAAGQDEDDAQGAYDCIREGQELKGGMAGSPPYVPPVRRCVDVHRQEPVVQDGVERAGGCAADQDHCVQERRGDRGSEQKVELAGYVFHFDRIICFRTSPRSLKGE